MDYLENMGHLMAHFYQIRKYVPFYFGHILALQASAIAGTALKGLNGLLLCEVICEILALRANN